MKVRNRYRFSRIWLAFATVLLGVLAGELVGRESIVHATHERLRDYANRILQREDDLGAEVTDVLRESNASRFPPCSEDDLALLRRLAFESRFLKDIGRLHSGSFVCAAASGISKTPHPLLKADLTLANGLNIYPNYPLRQPEGDHALIMVQQNAGVVVSPDVLAEFSQDPIHYKTRIIVPPTAAPQTQVSSLMIPTSTVAPTGNFLRENGNIVLAQCSRRFPLCVETSIGMAEVWKSTRGLMFGYIATGTTAGVVCALTLLLAGSKGPTHTSQLKRAILLGKLSVAYQPIVELGSHHILGAEALARWTDEDGESIRPETILALAEAEGFVSEITRFVVSRSLEELRVIFESNPDFLLSINLAPTDLADPRLLLLLDEKLANGPIAPHNLAFELPERATFDREVAIRSIRRLRDRGHAVFIDDFGTGYSNLTYLSELNVDGIKINRSFIGTIGTESVTASIVPQILAVAQALDLKVVLQGIEREEQANYFASSNPLMLAQGWFFGLPVPARSLLFLCAEKAE